MNGGHLIECIRIIPGLSHEFGGIFLNSNIPPKLKKSRNLFFIVNTIKDPIMEKIGHWVLFYIKDYKLYFFDSYGITPDWYGGDIAEFYYNHQFPSECVIRYELQQDSSFVCGIYCLFFCQKMYKNCPIKTIKNYFGCNKKNNDSLMMKYFYHVMGINFEKFIAKTKV